MWQITAAKILFGLVCIPQIIGGVLYTVYGSDAVKVVGVSSVVYGLLNCWLFYIVPVIYK